MAAAVDFIVLDTKPVPEPIAGVTIGIFDPSTRALLAQGTTGLSGYASFLLPGSAAPGTPYEVRLFKMGALFQNPRTVQVLEPVARPDQNEFEVHGSYDGLPASPDPYCCRCTGRFLDFSNRPVANTRVRVSQLLEDPTPEVVDGNLVVSQRMEFSTDRNGLVTFDLLRGGRYLLSFTGEEERVYPIEIPDRASMNLTDLIFPAPASLDWDQTAAPANQVTLSLATPAAVPVPMTVTLTDYEVRTSAIGAWIDAYVSDSAVVSASIQDGSLVLSPVSAGTATVTVVPQPNIRPVRSPPPSISYIPLTVVVGP